MVRMSLDVQECSWFYRRPNKPAQNFTVYEDIISKYKGIRGNIVDNSWRITVRPPEPGHSKQSKPIRALIENKGWLFFS